jgi:hypothetical protein
VSAPNYVCEIVCLASSRKWSGLCVAGKLVDGPRKGSWIRPVSARPTRELSEKERRSKDGADPALFDVISIPMASSSSHAFQTENHRIDERFLWSWTRRAGWTDVLFLLDDVRGALWENSSSSIGGLHDRVDERRAPALVSRFGGSLCFVRVSDLTIVVSTEGADFDARRKVRGEFNCGAQRYRLATTDPQIERLYLAKPDGRYHAGDALLCISLGDAYNGYAYKLIAGIFLPPPR